LWIEKIKDREFKEDVERRTSQAKKGKDKGRDR
jgi:hypothetical protein